MSGTVKMAVVGVLALTLSGCALFGGGGQRPTQADGGVFKSIDAGGTWTQMVEILAVGGQVIRFPNGDITQIILDPQDHNAVFAGTVGAGLLYSYDGAQSWTLEPFFANRNVISVAIDHFDKCRWVVATERQVYRTIDCGRGWREMLTETREGYTFNNVLTDHFNRNTLYVFNTREVLKSNNYGETWQTIQRFNSEIRDVVMSSFDSRELMLGFWGGGIHRTRDGGQTWTDLSPNMAEFRDAALVRDLKQDLTKSNSYIAATGYGLLRTIDGGETWNAPELLTPPGSVNIWSAGIDPQDPNILYYATDTTFYKTVDGGQNWRTQPLVTTRRPVSLTVDFRDGNVIYLGTRFFPN